MKSTPGVDLGVPTASYHINIYPCSWFSNASETLFSYGSPQSNSYLRSQEDPPPQTPYISSLISSSPTILSIQKDFFFYHLNITTLEQKHHLLSLNCHDSLLIGLLTIISVSLSFILHKEAIFFFLFLMYQIFPLLKPSGSFPSHLELNPDSLPKPKTAIMICGPASLLPFPSSMNYAVLPDFYVLPEAHLAWFSNPSTFL